MGVARHVEVLRLCAQELDLSYNQLESLPDELLLLPSLGVQYLLCTCSLTVCLLQCGVTQGTIALATSLSWRAERASRYLSCSSVTAVCCVCSPPELAVQGSIN